MTSVPPAPTPAAARLLPRRVRRLIDRHFAGRLSRRGERALRARLPEDEAARAYYERRQLLARLDPRALSAEQRLARGLGLGPAPRPARSLLLWGATGAALAGGLVAVLVSQGLPGWGTGRPQHPAEHGGSGFTARGSATVLPVLEIFTVTGGARAAPVGDGITRGAELGFAYRNPRRRAYLLLFALDNARRVYWYHPAFTDPRSDPVAVAISKAEGLHELGEAIAHDYRGSTLAVHALFSDRPWTVRAIEAALRRANRAPDEALVLPATDDHVTRLRVRR